VGNLITYTKKVPEWITGIDRNPLAGVTGILLLSAIALSVRGFLNNGQISKNNSG
jgi:hypothetical protein